MSNSTCGSDLIEEQLWYRLYDSCPIGVSADSCPAGAPWMRE